MQEVIKNKSCHHCSNPAKYVVNLTTEDISTALCDECFFIFGIETRSANDIADLMYDAKGASFAADVVLRLAQRIRDEHK